VILTVEDAHGQGRASQEALKGLLGQGPVPESGRLREICVQPVVHTVTDVVAECALVFTAGTRSTGFALNDAVRPVTLISLLVHVYSTGPNITDDAIIPRQTY